MAGPLREGVSDPKARLEDQVSLLPTPRTSDTNGPGQHGDGGIDLRTAASLLPTPTTDPDTGNGHARNLGTETRLLPTPVVTDANGARNATSGRKPGSQHHTGTTLLDVFWTGPDTHRPSDGGNTSSDGPHQPPLF
jgi:hypothetical protein